MTRPTKPTVLSYLHPKAREGRAAEQQRAYSDAVQSGRVRMLADFADAELDEIARRYGCRTPVRKRQSDPE